MKKFLIFLATFALALTLTGCTGEELPEIPEEVTMSNVDEFLGRADVQYVDLRNFDDKMKSGYIAGFEFIPFFDYLEATDVLVRTDGDWNYAAADLVSKSALEGLFDSEKTIFLMCGSGTRAGYVKAALEAAGYTNVINVGGIADYAGDNKVDGDGSYNVEVQLPLPTTVDMDNIDMYLGRNDVQYVDLRNFDDKMKSGYIAGFEFIPFFDYLELEDILVRTDGDWNYAAEDTVSVNALKALFDADKTIFLMCGSGTRAGYVKAALEAAGYTDVLNVGGISSYAGDNKVEGDGTYALNADVKGSYTPGTYFGSDPISGYTATVVINANGGIGNVIFDAINGNTTKQVQGFDYGMVARGASMEWFQHADKLADYVIAKQGWGTIELDETTYDATWNAMTVPHHIIEFDHEDTIDAAKSPDDIAGVTIGAEGFVFAWNAAIAQATTAGTDGLVDVTITQSQWAAAHLNAYTYEDGVYFGHEGGYTALITIEGGMIVDVFLDAAHFSYGTTSFLSMKRDYADASEYGMNYQVDGNDDLIVDADGNYVLVQMQTEGADTPLDDTDDVFVDKLDWWMQADALQDAILDAQTWSTDWVMDGDAFDLTDDDTADALAGVSIGVDNWKTAVEEALGKAAPAS